MQSLPPGRHERRHAGSNCRRTDVACPAQSPAASTREFVTSRSLGWSSSPRPGTRRRRPGERPSFSGNTYTTQLVRTTHHRLDHALEERHRHVDAAVRNSTLRGVVGREAFEATLFRIDGPNPVHRHRGVVIDPHHVFARSIAARSADETAGRRRALFGPHLGNRPRADAGTTESSPAAAPSKHRARVDQHAAGVEHEHARIALVEDDERQVLVVLENARPSWRRNAHRPRRRGRRSRRRGRRRFPRSIADEIGCACGALKTGRSRGLPVRQRQHQHGGAQQHALTASLPTIRQECWKGHPAASWCGLAVA